jgi:hypothetical protein
MMRERERERERRKEKKREIFFMKEETKKFA